MSSVERAGERARGHLWGGPAAVGCLVCALVLPRAARADDCPASPEILARNATIAVSAYASMDDAGFARAQQQMLDDLACLDAPPSPAQAALVHEVRGLAAFVGGDRDGALRSLRAMHEADPSARLSSEIAPPGSPLDDLFQAALGSASSSRVVGRVLDPCRLTVDGVVAHDLPRDNPSLVVIQDPAGSALWSGLLPPDPAVLTLCQAPAPALDLPGQPAGRRRAAVGLEIAAGSTTALAAMLWTGALYDLATVRRVQRGLQQGLSAEELGVNDSVVRRRLERTDQLALAAQLSTEVALTFGAFAVGVRLRW